jgi:hypothetical protein
MNDTKIVNKRLLCNNMSRYPEPETIDMTPTWTTAINLWFVAIDSHVDDAGKETVRLAKLEVQRLADAYELAVEHIATVEGERDEARSAVQTFSDGLEDLPSYERSWGEYINLRDTTPLKQDIAATLKEWEPDSDAEPKLI